MDNNIADALDLPVNLMSDEIEKQFLERARNLNLDFFAKKPSKLLMRSS